MFFFFLLDNNLISVIFTRQLSGSERYTIWDFWTQSSNGGFRTEYRQHCRHLLALINKWTNEKINQIWSVINFILLYNHMLSNPFFFVLLLLLLLMLLFLLIFFYYLICDTAICTFEITVTFYSKYNKQIFFLLTLYLSL